MCVCFVFFLFSIWICCLPSPSYRIETLWNKNTLFQNTLTYHPSYRLLNQRSIYLKPIAYRPGYRSLWSGRISHKELWLTMMAFESSTDSYSGTASTCNYMSATYIWLHPNFAFSCKFYLVDYRFDHSIPEFIHSALAGNLLGGATYRSVLGSIVYSMPLIPRNRVESKRLKAHLFSLVFKDLES